MPPSINQVRLMGTVGRTPTWGTLPGGAPFCQVALATDDTDQDRRTGQPMRVTSWHRIVLTGSAAQTIRGALDRGDRLHVEGRLQTRKWTDRDGAVRYTTEVVAPSAQVYQRPGKTKPPEAVAAGPGYRGLAGRLRLRIVAAGGPCLQGPTAADKGGAWRCVAERREMIALDWPLILWSGGSTASMRIDFGGNYFAHRRHPRRPADYVHYTASGNAKRGEYAA
jgi:single-strand DNA-binding protein